ncbi:MAG: hypothetical protein V3T86_02730 [Planctomycetota bacterium]
MRTQKCTNCGTTLDVTQLEKGSKFACSTCGEVLSAGEAVAVKRSLKDGPAFQPKTGKQASTGATPTRGSRSSAAAPTGRRSSGTKTAARTGARSRRPAEDYDEAAPAKKSAMPLIAGVGAIVVVGIVVVVMSNRGGEDTAGSGSGGGGSVAVAPKQSPADWWGEIALNADGTEKDLEKGAIERIFSEASSKEYDQDAAFWGAKKMALMAQLLKVDPNNETANRAAGKKALRDHPGFEELWMKVTAETGLPENIVAFRDKYEDRVEAGEDVWLDTPEFTEVSTEMTGIKKYLEELANDPYRKQILRAIERTKNHPVLMHYESVQVVAHPFIVFLGSRELKVMEDTPEEKKRVAKKRKEMEIEAEKYRKIYAGFVKHWDENYRKPMGLPKLKPSDILFQWIFEDKKGLDAYQMKAEGRPLPSGVLGYFSPWNRWVFLFLRENDESSGISALNVMCHESTHHLHWKFSEDPKDRFTNYFDEGGCVFFNEGFAELLGGSGRIKPGTDGEPEFEWYAIGRLEGIRRMKKNGVPLLPIKDLVPRESYSEYQNWIRDSWIERVRPITPEASHKFLSPRYYFGAALYPQSYVLATFLTHYENGKYREKFLEFAMAMFRGRIKPAKYGGDGEKRWRDAYGAFVEIFFDNKNEEAAFVAMQKEHDAFQDELLKNAPRPPKRKDPAEEEDDEEEDEDAESELEGVDDDEDEEEDD